MLGTEDSRVLLLGAGCTSVSSSITLPAVPALLSAVGGLDAGYRVTVATRDGWLYSIKAGALTRTVLQLDSQPVGLVGGADCFHCAVQSLHIPRHSVCWCCQDGHIRACCCRGAYAQLYTFGGV